MAEPIPIVQEPITAPLTNEPVSNIPTQPPVQNITPVVVPVIPPATPAVPVIPGASVTPTPVIIVEAPPSAAQLTIDAQSAISAVDKAYGRM